MSKSFKHKFVSRKVAELLRYDRNARTHSEAQVAQIATSIKEFGFTCPVLIDETNTIIAGEGRWLAAQKLELDTVPCIVLAGLTEAQKAAYAIADNKLALNAGWDTDRLLAELGHLADLEFDTSLTGFSEVELLALLDAVAAEVDDLVPATNAPAADGAGPPTGDAPAAGGTRPGSQPDWSGMPEFDQRDAGPFRSLLVHFKDQAAVDAFSTLIGQRLTDKTKYVWHPQQVKVAAPEVVYA